MAWVKVCWAAGCRGTYNITVANGRPREIPWRRYSVFPPWYTFGNFDSRTAFGATFICDPYCDFWFFLEGAETYNAQFPRGNDGTFNGLTPCFGNKP